MVHEFKKKMGVKIVNSPEAVFSIHQIQSDLANGYTSVSREIV